MAIRIEELPEAIDQLVDTVENDGEKVRKNLSMFILTLLLHEWRSILPRGHFIHTDKSYSTWRERTEELRKKLDEVESEESGT